MHIVLYNSNMQPAVCTCKASVYSTTFSNIWSLCTDTVPSRLGLQGYAA